MARHSHTAEQKDAQFALIERSQDDRIALATPMFVALFAQNRMRRLAH
jgi:hypothetical protein